MKRWLLMLLVCVSCGDEIPRTEVVVFVRAEDLVRADADRLEVVVRGGPTGGARETIGTFLYTDASVDEGFPLSWPVRLGLVPSGNDSTRSYEVIATASDGDAQIAQTRVVSSYLERETLTLDVWLRNDCVGVICLEDETCERGTCGEASPIDPCLLPRFESGELPCGGDAGLDAGIDAPADVAIDTRDVGVDAFDASPDLDGGRDAGPLHNVAFISSMPIIPRDLGGLENADAHCQTLADASSTVPPATYLAFMAGSGLDTVRTRFVSARGWVRPDGLPFADTIGDIAAGRIFYPIRFSEQVGAPAEYRMVSGLETNLDNDLLTCGFWTTGGSSNDGDGRDGTGSWLRTGGAIVGRFDRSIASESTKTSRSTHLRCRRTCQSPSSARAVCRERRESRHSIRCVPTTRRARA